MLLRSITTGWVVKSWANCTLKFRPSVIQVNGMLYLLPLLKLQISTTYTLQDCIWFKRSSTLIFNCKFKLVYVYNILFVTFNNINSIYHTGFTNRDVRAQSFVFVRILFIWRRRDAMILIKFSNHAPQHIPPHSLPSCGAQYYCHGIRLLIIYSFFFKKNLSFNCYLRYFL